MAAEQEPWVVLTLGLFTLVGVLTSAVLGFLAQKHAREGSKQAAQANDAVNHRHEGAPRLFDMVSDLGFQLEEHRVANRDQHASIMDAVIENRDALVKRADANRDAIEQNRKALEAHVEWEEKYKYPVIEEVIRTKEGT